MLIKYKNFIDYLKKKSVILRRTRLNKVRTRNQFSRIRANRTKAVMPVGCFVEVRNTSACSEDIEF